MRFFLSTQFWLPRFRVLLSTHDFLPIFSPLFSGGTLFLLWSWCPRLRETRGGARLSPFFPCKRGGQRVRCDIFAPNTGGRRFFCAFFGGCFWVFCPFSVFGGVGFRKGSSRSKKSRGTWIRRSRGRRRRRRKKKKKIKKQKKMKKKKNKEKKKKEKTNNKEGKKGK